MQDVLAILSASIAAAFLARRAWQRFSRRSGACGSCPSCGSNDVLKSKPLVTITPMACRTQAQERDNSGS
jgi:hypothetical protein